MSMSKSAVRLSIGLSLVLQMGAAPAKAPRTPAVGSLRQEASRFEYTEYHMGVDVRLVVYAPARDIAERACAAAFERFAALDTEMSDYRADSELMRLCAHAGGPAVPVSPDLYRVLERSQLLARQSGGAFDCTCSPLVKLWRKARKTGAAPSAQDVARAQSLTGWRSVVLDPRRRTVRLLKPRMLLDLGGIAKGYADDCAQSVLKRSGIQSALVEAGGDIVVSDPPPGQPGWKIEVPNAQDATPRIFANCAVSTSGDIEQSVEIDGKRYSHIIDPRVGQPLTDRIQVTVVAKDGLTSDGLSTAVSVLGAVEGRRLADRYPGTKLFIRFGASDDEKRPSRKPDNSRPTPPNP